MEKENKKIKHKSKIIISVVVIVLVAFIGVYFGTYYHSVGVEEYLESNEKVEVNNFEHGILFDGPGEKEAMIFYPGAKVATEAYAPLMHKLAENGIDCFLVDMPCHMAFFGMNRAEKIMEAYDYDTWYLGGHSLGGAMIANVAAEHTDQVDGLLLLAAYTTKDLSKSDMKVTTIYGSEDGVVNMDKIKESRKLLPDGSVEKCIEGGNHAQFASYGKQKGDGEAKISGEEQIEETVETFLGR